MTQRIDAPHYSAGFEQNDEGWYEPECNCGWKFGPCPDAETAADALMQHAYEQGIIDQRAGRGV